MKLSVIALLFATATGIQAASTHKSSTECQMGNPGKKLGDGWQGYCCKTDDDCRESCVNHKCNGRPNPKYAEPILPKGCAAGSYGYGLGDGYYGDCCVNSDDCRDTCVKNKCNGPKRSSK